MSSNGFRYWPCFHGITSRCSIFALVSCISYMSISVFLQPSSILLGPHVVVHRDHLFHQPSFPVLPLHHEPSRSSSPSTSWILMLSLEIHVREFALRRLLDSLTEIYLSFPTHLEVGVL
ncbi:hypothetical protein BJX96DRAFT_151243, partial [Aspergillus floccosus]